MDFPETVSGVTESNPAQGGADNASAGAPASTTGTEESSSPESTQETETASRRPFDLEGLDQWAKKEFENEDQPSTTDKKVESVPELRTAYGQAVEESKALKAQVAEWEPRQTTVEAFGGWDQFHQAAEFGRLLFSQLVDPVTQAPRVDNQGMPMTSPGPFLDAIRQYSPGTYYDLLDIALQGHIPDGRPALEAIVTDVLKLDPNLLEVYRSIKTAEDARQYGVGVTDDELADIPQQFHEVYKAMPKYDREALLNMSASAKQQKLLDAQRQQRMMSQQEQMQQQLRQQQEQQQQAYWRQVEQQGASDAQELYNTGRAALAQEFGTIALTGDPDIDGEIGQMTLARMEKFIYEENQETALMAQRAEILCRQARQDEARGEKYRAGMARQEAQRLQLQIVNKARAYGRTLTAKVQKGRGGVTPPQTQNRQVIPGSNNFGTQTPRPQQQNGYKPFSTDRADEIARNISGG